MGVNMDIIPQKIDLSDEVDNFTIEYTTENGEKHLRLSNRFLRDEAEKEIRITVLESNLAIEGADDDLSDIFTESKPYGIKDTIIVSETTAGFDRTNFFYSNALENITQIGSQVTLFTTAHGTKQTGFVVATTYDFSTPEYIHSVSAEINNEDANTYSYCYFRIYYTDGTYYASPEYQSLGTTYTLFEFENPYPLKKVTKIIYYYKSGSGSFYAHIRNGAYKPLTITDSPLGTPTTKVIILDYNKPKPTYAYLFLFDENNDVSNIGDVTYKFSDGTNETAELNPYEIVNLGTLSFTPDRVIITQKDTAESHIAKFVLLISTS